MLNLILGILVGMLGMRLYQMSKLEKKVTWFAWLIFGTAAGLIVLGFDILTGSFIEHEIQAAWMGFGLSVFTAIVLIVTGWRYGVSDRA